jgi:4-carboxymuconolactone decarboxylase
MPDKNYYHRDHLTRFSEIGKNRPELAEKFFDYYDAVMGEGAL